MAEGSSHYVDDDGLDPETEGMRLVYTDSNERIKQNHVYTHVESVGQLAENSAAILDQFNATEFTVSIPEGRMNGVRNPERILGANSDKPHVTTVLAMQVLDNGRGFRKLNAATIMRNGYRGHIKKLFGKNNQGLKQVMSKFSPAWALMFSIARDAQDRLWYTLLGYGSNFELRGLLEYRTISWPREVKGSKWREVAAHAEFDGGVKTAEQFFRSDGGMQWAPLEDLRDAYRYFDKIKETGVLALLPLGQALQGEEQPPPQVQVTDNDIKLQGESLHDTLSRYFVAPEMRLMPQSFWDDGHWNGFKMKLKVRGGTTIECNPYMPDFPVSDPIEIRVGQAHHTVIYGPYFSSTHDANSLFPYKHTEGNLMHQKNYVLHLTTNSRVMNPKENPYFPEYHGERVDYFHHHRNTAQQLSSPLLQKLLEAMCKGRQDNADEPEQYQEFMECLDRLLVFDRENPYLDRNIEYRKQMKNLQWLLGNPFEVFVSLDTGYTQFNEKKNDIVDDALLRDIFYGSVQIAVAFDVLKRFENGLKTIAATLDAQDAARATAAAAKKTRVQPARQGPAPRPTSPAPAGSTPKAARKVTSPSKAAARGTKRARSAAGSRPLLGPKRTPVAGSPSASSANPLRRFAEIAGEQRDNPTPSASRGEQESSGHSASRPRAPASAPAATRGNAGSQLSKRSAPQPEAAPHDDTNPSTSARRLPRYGRLDTPEDKAIKECLQSGDVEVLGVFAQMATVDDQELSQVLAHYYGCQLSTVVVESQVCAESLTLMLKHSNSYLPDILPLDHCHVKDFSGGLLLQPDDDQAVRLMEAACRGSDEALRVPLPGTGALGADIESGPAAWPQGCLGYAFNLVCPTRAGDRAHLLYNMLGHTIVFRTLAEASAYRLDVAKASDASVPDIVTLDGRHISTQGIISGDSFKPVLLDEALCCFGST